MTTMTTMTTTNDTADVADRAHQLTGRPVTVYTHNPQWGTVVTSLGVKDTCSIRAEVNLLNCG